VPWSVIEEEFRLEDVNPSPAFFDVKKLRAFNGEYIRALPLEDFVERCRPWLGEPYAPWPPEQYDEDVFRALAPLAQTRVAVLSEITAIVDFAFLDEPVMDEASWAKAMKEPAAAILAAAVEAYEDAPWTAEELKSRTEEIGVRHGLKLGKTQAPIRVAVTGRTVGLPLFESLQIIGKERTLDRLRRAVQALT
jgi:glutamyl-tRNA synthetase